MKSTTQEREEEDKMKNRKEKERKRVGSMNVETEPSAILYIGILVTSTTTGHDGSVVSALAYQAKGRGSIPSCGRVFFHKYFLLPFPTSVENTPSPRPPN